MKQRHQTPATSGQRSSSSQAGGGGTLRETLLTELRDIYDAEQQLVKALPKMVQAAGNEELRTAFEAHLSETQGQVERLEQAFQMFQQKPSGKTCKAMQGLIAEGEELISEGEGDAALICAAQKVEHYEIASYGSLASWARLLDMTEAADLFEETLEEEKKADEKLTRIAETSANVEEAEEEEETA